MINILSNQSQCKTKSSSTILMNYFNISHGNIDAVYLQCWTYIFKMSKRFNWNVEFSKKVRQVKIYSYWILFCCKNSK